MGGFQIITVIGLFVTSFLGGINLYLSLYNRRKAHRELVFEKQLHTYLEINKRLSVIINTLGDIAYLELSSEKANEKMAIFYQALDDFDGYIEDNEIIISEEVYEQYMEVGKLLLELRKRDFDVMIEFTKEEYRDHLYALYDFTDALRMELGVGKLSRENRSLVRERWVI